MNTSLLKYLVSLARNQVDVIDTNALFEEYPRETYSSDLYSSPFSEKCSRCILELLFVYVYTSCFVGLC